MTTELFGTMACFWCTEICHALMEFEHLTDDVEYLADYIKENAQINLEDVLEAIVFHSERIQQVFI